jgi:CheY-like chemotaxis protein
MPPEVLDRAFEPFFTTKEVGKGSGLGLAQVFGFTKQSGGGVKITTSLGEGTRVDVYVPRAEHAVPAPRSKPRERSAVPQGSVVLVVDDDDAVREVTATVLGGLGFSVAEAGSGQAALDMLAGGVSPDLVLLDYAMPGMNGIDTASEIGRRHPGLPILFLTGFADAARLSQIDEQDVILKPFRADELDRKVRDALSRRSAPTPGP